MRVLHHYMLSSGSRFVRLYLAEQKMEFLPKLEEYWKSDSAFLKLNVAGTVPVLVEDDGTVLCGGYAIAEYFDDIMPDTTLITGSAAERAEIRRLFDWVSCRFEREVLQPLINERLIRRMTGDGVPSSVVIRTALSNLSVHLAYFNHLVERRPWLAGSKMSVADLMAVASLSVLDFMNDMNWEDWGELKIWYARIKSRPSFRALLADQVTGITPPSHYTNLDF
ncbi:MAG: glutathione S-transferase family protein [Candidatus Puniceispirillales bacterium]